jgi:hypothetical protein
MLKIEAAAETLTCLRTPVWIGAGPRLCMQFPPQLASDAQSTSGTMA